MIKKNDTVTVEIVSITNLGFGVGRYNGIVIFVSGLVKGDVAEVKIIKTAPSYAVGRTERIISPSALRVEGRCSVRGCSSCAYRQIAYGEELKIKKENVISAFAKAGLSDVFIEDVVPSPEEKGYRNKAQYPISKDKNGNYLIGFYAPKSHRVTEARNCPLLPRVFSEILNSLADFFKKYSLSVYDESSGKGLLRHVYLRRGEMSGEILLTLVVNGEGIEHSDELVSSVKERFPSVVGILINENKNDTNVILGEKFSVLYGRDYIYDTLSGVNLKITAPSFYQVNRKAAELLYRKAAELLKPEKSDVLLDLYCGAGSIGLSMAGSVSELIGIEIIESAVLCARENAENNGILNAKFYTGDASNCENLLANAEKELKRKIKPSLIILDPPRSGCSEKLIKYTASLSPKRIAYISCNPQTLARDASIFESLGYSADTVFPFDLFALTGHVESLVCLTKQTN